jgi:hypothetical protein
MAEAQGILFDEQAIERPPRMAVEGRYTLTHLQRIAAMEMQLIIYQLQELLNGGIALVALKNIEEIAKPHFS